MEEVPEREKWVELDPSVWQLAFLPDRLDRTTSLVYEDSH